MDPNSKGGQPTASGETLPSAPDKEHTPPDKGQTPTREVTAERDISRTSPEAPASAKPQSPSPLQSGKLSPLPLSQEKESDSDIGANTDTDRSEPRILHAADTIEFLATSGLLKIDASKLPALKALNNILPPKPEALAEWLAENDDHVFATMCFALVELTKPDSSNKDKASHLLRTACEASPEFAVTQINCWMALQRLSEPDSLTQDEISHAIAAFKGGNLYHIPMAAWMAGLVDLGLIPRLPPGNPKDAAKHLLNAAVWMNPENRKMDPLQVPRVLEYTCDPFTFSHWEKIAKTDSHMPQNPERFRKGALKKANHQYLDQQLLPWFLKVSNGICGKPQHLDEVLADLSIDKPLVKILRLLNNIQLIFKFAHAEYIVTVTPVSEKLKNAQKLKLMAESQGKKEAIKVFEKKCFEFEQELFAIINEFKPVYDDESRALYTFYLEQLETLIFQSKLSPGLSGIIHSFLGMACESGVKIDKFNRLHAAQHYLQAGLSAPYCEQLIYAIKVFRDYQYYEDAARACRILAKANLELTPEECSKYEEQATEFDHMAAERIRVLSEDSSKHKKSSERTARKLKKQAAAPADKSPKQSDGATANFEPELPDPPGKPTQVQKPSLPDLVPSQEQADNPDKNEAEQAKKRSLPELDDGSEDHNDWEVVKAKKSTPSYLLSGQWDSDIHDIIRTVWYFQHNGNSEAVGEILEDALKVHTHSRGIERLHEEYAWHLYRSVDQPQYFFSADELVSEDFKKHSAQRLSEAKEHLRIAIARKLGLSPEQLPEDLKQCQDLADERATLFPPGRDREEYLDGVSYIMRSLGHMYDGFSSVVSRRGASSMKSRREGAYREKRSTHTKSSSGK